LGEIVPIDFSEKSFPPTRESTLCAPPQLKFPDPRENESPQYLQVVWMNPRRFFTISPAYSFFVPLPFSQELRHPIMDD